VSVGAWLRRNVAYPLWVARDRSPRLQRYRYLKRTQYFPAAQLRAIQLEGLRKTLLGAWQNTEYYREAFDAAGFDPRTFSSFEDLARVPILEKEAVRTRAESMRSRAHLDCRMSEFRTGGSTGKPVTVYRSSETIELSNASALRVFEWTGAQIGEPWGLVWGNPPEFVTPKQKLRNWLIDREIYLDTMKLTEASMRAFCDTWSRVRPTMLRGHSHSIYIFASFCLSAGITTVRPKGVISSSMMLLAPERAVIEKAFGCQVTDLYGCEELGLIGCECEQHSGMHLDMENVYVEIVDSAGRPVPDGEQGAVVVTCLIADAFPFIRYRLGDIASIRPEPCKCGRGLVVMNPVAGRVADFFVRPDGAVVAGVSLVERTLTRFPGVAQMQMIQESLARIVLKIVRAPEYDSDTERGLIDELKASVGASEVVIDFVEAIPQEPNGKFRFAISRVRNPFSV
jgi:phenylacetate-CoA ligase